MPRKHTRRTERSGTLVSGQAQRLANLRPLSFESLEHRCLLVAGMLDPMFGFGGMVATDLAGASDQAWRVAVQSDGKIVVAGNTFGANFNDWALARYNADGTLDSTFGQDGKVITDFGSSAREVVLQDDGKIIVAGYTGASLSDLDFALARYDTTGRLDTTFGMNGKVRTDFSGYEDQCRGAVLQSDGKIVLAGFSHNGTNYDFAVARFNADGSLDSSFDGDGRATTDFGGVGAQGDRGLSAALQSDGKIVIAGYLDNGGNNYAIAMTRFNANGTLDSSFGNEGQVTTTFPGTNSIGENIALQNDGKIIVAGHLEGNSQGFAVVRYNANGTLDSSLDGDGRVITRVGQTNDFTGGVAVQNDGRILVAGYAYFDSPTFWDIVLVRYDANGALDLTFNGGGKVTTNSGAEFDAVNSLVLQSDGKIIVAGSRGGKGTTSTDITLARYEGDPISTLVGDYNRSGTVDAADYVLWRNTRGAVVAAYSGADGDGDGAIDQDDYDLWRANFGHMLPVASSAALAAPSAPDNAVTPALPTIDSVTSTAMPTTGRRNLRPQSISRNIEAFAASRDQALLALVAAKPAGPRRALMGADFSESLREPASDQISIEAASALDSAFGSLQDTD
jgi:uncharacterized delta-60 repeat protein